jgi:D-alanine-D-alanine ligase
VRTKLTKKLTIALLSGGTSSEREVSLNSGAQVFEALDPDKYTVLRYDPQSDLPRLVADAARIDAALIILHGANGEDGTVQGLLDLLNIPYQGAGVLGSAVAMNKLAAKRLYEHAGLPVPAYAVVRRGQALEPDALANRLGLPLVVKPVVGGSSVGISIVRRMEDLQAAVGSALRHDAMVLIEAYIHGTEITGGVLGNDMLEALPIIEIIPTTGHEFFDYQAKYLPGSGAHRRGVDRPGAALRHGGPPGTFLPGVQPHRHDVEGPRYFHSRNQHHSRHDLDQPAPAGGPHRRDEFQPPSGPADRTQPRRPGGGTVRP